MRREELVTAIGNVIKLLKDTEIAAVLIEVYKKRSTKSETGGVAPDSTLMLLEVFQRYSVLLSKMGSVEHEIISILELTALSASSFWVRGILTSRAPILSSYIDKIRTIEKVLPAIVKLFEQEYVNEIRANDTQNLPSELQDKDILTVTLPEKHGQFSTAARLINVLEAVECIHQDLLKIYPNAPQEPLIVLACDSGSDKSITLAVAAEILKPLNNILSSVWRWAVYHDNDKNSANMRSILERAEAYKVVCELEHDEQMPREQAEIVKRSLAEGMVKFASTGATTLDMYQQKALSEPHILMGVLSEPKLITGTPDPISEPPITTKAMLETDNSDSRTSKLEAELKKLTSEQQTVLLQMLEAMGGTTSEATRILPSDSNDDPEISDEE